MTGRKISLAAIGFIAALSLLPRCSGDGGGGMFPFFGGSDTVTQTVGPAGGTVSHPGGASVTIPAGALLVDTEISITGHADSQAVSRAYGIAPFQGGAEFGPAGQTFLKPVTITLPVGTALQPYEEHSLYVYDGVEAWEDTAAAAAANGDGTRVTAQVTHFSGYASLDIPPAMLEQFRSFWSGGDPTAALGSYIAWFLTTTDFMGYTVRTDDYVAEVEGIHFSVNTGGGNAASLYGTGTSGTTTSLNYSHDYTGPGGASLHYDLLVTLYWKVTEEERHQVSVDIIEPVPGSQVSGITRIGTFTRRAAKVEFHVDGVKVREDTDAPFGWLWNTSGCADGSHTLKAIAYDSGSASSESETVTVTVNNTTQGPRAVYFTDGDMHEKEIGGTVSIRKADDETAITHYVAYYGDGTRTRVAGQAAIATIPKTGSDVSCVIADDTAIPAGATHILVFAKTAGGEVENPAAVAIQDSRAGPQVGAWGSMMNLPEQRCDHTSIQYKDYVYMIAGQTPYYGFRSDVIYAHIDPYGNIGSWNSASALPTSRFDHSSVEYNGYVYVIGGGGGTGLSTDVYYSRMNSDGTLDPWLKTADMPFNRGRHTSVIYNGYLYALGGYTTAYTGSVIYAKINPDGNVSSWTTSTSFNTGRAEHSSIVYNGKIYVIGGYIYDDGDVYILNGVQFASINNDGSLGTWTNTTALPSARCNHESIEYNGYLYVIGGEYIDSDYHHYSDVFYAKINDNGTIGAWNSTASIGSARSSFSCITSRSKIYVLGGENITKSSGSTINDVQYAPFVTP